MLYYFKKGKKHNWNAKKDLCSVWRRCCDWSNMSKVVCKVSCWSFLTGQCSRTVRPVKVDSDQIETLIENNQRYTTWEIADILIISKSSIENHLHQLGYVNRFDVWVPHKLSKKNLDRISACDSLFKHKENVPFLKQIVMGDESGFCTIMWNRRDRRASEMNHHQPHQRLFFIQRRWHCVDDRIGREFSIMSSFQKTKRLIPASTASS